MHHPALTCRQRHFLHVEINRPVSHPFPPAHSQLRQSTSALGIASRRISGVETRQLSSLLFRAQPQACITHDAPPTMQCVRTTRCCHLCSAAIHARPPAAIRLRISFFRRDNLPGTTFAICIPVRSRVWCGPPAAVGVVAYQTACPAAIKASKYCL